MIDRNVGRTDRRSENTRSIGGRLAKVGTVVGALLLFSITTPPVGANVFGDLGNLYGCVVTWGQVCNLSHTVIGTGPAQSTPPIPVTCERPLLNGLPQFLSWPKGQAKYGFQSTCSSPALPGTVMTIRWEGTWNPSETKTDRPNAVESLTITGYEAFLPDRSPGDKVFMYFTARCTKDPWLQAGSIGKRAIVQAGPAIVFGQGRESKESAVCTPFGGYVPDDLRATLPDVDKQSFPKTGNIISAADKRRLTAEYERVNPSYFSRMGIQPRPLSNVFQAPIPPSTGIVPKPSAQLKIFSRGTEPVEQLQPEQQALQEPSELGAPSLGEGVDDSPALPPVAITFDRPLHFPSTKGEDTLVPAGLYEIEPVLDLQLSLSREGQDAVLVLAMQGTHSEAIQQPVALLVQGESDHEQHLVFMTPDGKRFDALGSTSGVKSRGTDIVVALPNRNLRDAIIQASAQPAAGPPPPCLRSTLPIGPRWLPPGCNLGVPSIPGGAPVPYVDGSNMLHACLNNNTGVFRLVRPADDCVALYGEVKVKWQLAP